MLCLTLGVGYLYTHVLIKMYVIGVANGIERCQYYQWVSTLLMLLTVVRITSSFYTISATGVGCYKWYCTWLWLLILCLSSIHGITRECL